MRPIPLWLYPCEAQSGIHEYYKITQRSLTMYYIFHSIPIFAPHSYRCTCSLSLSLSLSLSPSLSLSFTHTHTQTHMRAHARTHVHTNNNTLIQVYMHRYYNLSLIHI